MNEPDFFVRMMKRHMRTMKKVEDKVKMLYYYWKIDEGDEK